MPAVQLNMPLNPVAGKALGMCSIVRTASIGGPGDGDDVEPGRVFQQSVALEKGETQPREPLLLFGVDGFGRMAGGVDSRVLTSTNTTVCPSTATRSNSPKGEREPRATIL